MPYRSWLDAPQPALLESQKAETRRSHAALADEQEIAHVKKKAITLSPSGLSASMPYLCHRRE